MNKSELLAQYGTFSLNRITTKGLILDDDPFSFLLDDIDDCVRARNLYVSRGQLLIAKIVNYMLAVNEVEQDVAIYRHYPVLLHIELTNRCNCECIMCTHSYTKNDGATFCDISDLEKYFPTCRLIVINGIGEPFLHPDFIELYHSEIPSFIVQLQHALKKISGFLIKFNLFANAVDKSLQIFV